MGDIPVYIAKEMSAKTCMITDQSVAYHSLLSHNYRSALSRVVWVPSGRSPNTWTPLPARSNRKGRVRLQC